MLAGAAAPAAPVLVSGAFVQATAPGVPDASVYLTLRNKGARALVLTGGSTAAARSVVPMQQMNMSGMTMMHDMTSVTVPAGATVVFRPGGDHLMLKGVRAPLKAGASVNVTLHFKGYAPLKVTLPVKRL
ncbi:protein of unknown function DUF461 [Deinococcus maricopensis DSM 21211]|uniref:Copper chaperone PCu(A)C n=1 Tax=Deinococcus maricopensis (strain DSM 21211 / LMG 22137 / NRRL B-23946 / LB-34) TaxID=709986 RepID=E8U5R5_DEIML|nr:protein of unknown function DUF461 [Deinococcus maricopensis DSM 21211]